LAALGVAVIMILAAGGCDGRRPTGAARALKTDAARVGACYDAPILPQSMWSDGTPVVPCTEMHRAETYYTGTVDAPPDSAQVQDGSQELIKLYATCEAEAKTFLGADWYAGRLAILVTLPRPDDWQAGTRTFSCEVFEIDQPGHETAVRRTASLRGALAAPGPLAMGCFNMRNPPEWAPMVPAACDQPHDAEYVGATLAASELELETNTEALFDKCVDLLVGYVGSTNIRGYQYGYIGSSLSGELRVRCFAMPAAEGKRFTASVKGIGNRTPPTTG
jgi:hypothetical protein